MIKKISQLDELPSSFKDPEKMVFEVSYLSASVSNPHAADETPYYGSYQTTLADLEEVVGIAELSSTLDQLTADGVSAAGNSFRIGEPGSSEEDRIEEEYFPNQLASMTCYADVDLQNDLTAHGKTTFQNNVVLSCTDSDSENQNKPILWVGGTSRFDNTIYGTAYRALWGDLAECYAADADYPPGTIVAFGGSEEVTVAKDRANAVVTSRPGMTLNSSEEEKMKNPTRIALVGRVPIRVRGPVRKFDNIVLSKTEPGVGVVYNYSLPTEIVGKALEDNADDGEKLVLCVVSMKLV